MKISLDDPLSWQKISPKKLPTHIFERHLVPENHFIMLTIGVPRYDIELARHRGINLQGTVDSAMKRLRERPQGYETSSFRGLNKGEVLARALAYIQELELGKVDIDEVFDRIGGSRRVLRFGIDDISSERPFWETFQGDMSPYDVFMQEVIENPNAIYRDRLV